MRSRPTAPGRSDELTGRLRLLFPALPAGGVRRGNTWSDATEYHLTAEAFPGSERAVTTYHAEASDAPGMRKGITLRSDGSYDRKGTRNQGDQERCRLPELARARTSSDSTASSSRRAAPRPATCRSPCPLWARPCRSSSRAATPSRRPLPLIRRAPMTRPRLRRLLLYCLLPPAAFLTWLLAVWPPPVWVPDPLAGRDRLHGHAGESARQAALPPRATGLDGPGSARGRDDWRGRPVLDAWGNRLSGGASRAGLSAGAVRVGFGARPAGAAPGARRDLAAGGRRSAGPAPSPSRWPRISTCRRRGIRSGR